MPLAKTWQTRKPKSDIQSRQKVKYSITMKKIKFDKKLSLNKETIARLNDAQMGKVKGGEVAGILSLLGATCRKACDSCCRKGTQCN